MDYEKKYKEALERAMNLHKDAIDMGENLCAKQCEIIFPELIESEDEKTKRMLDIITYKMSQHQPDIFTGEENEWFNAWLEKKCEKPQGKTALEAIKEEKIDNANKFEPKLKRGDWVVHNISKYIFLVKRFNGGYCTLEDTNGNIYSPCLHPTEDLYHLWTIQDAKDGDVLVTYSGIVFIFENIMEGGTISFYVALSTSNFASNTKIHIPNDNERLCDQEVFPATKEQRDLLFQKMKEAGYEWDAEKKELKKIRQNHVDKVEPKFKVGDIIYRPSNSSCPVHSSIDDTLCTVIEVLDKHYILDTNEGKIQESFAWQDYYKLVRQTTWSEEDENRFNNLIYLVEYSNEGKETKEGFIKFINRLKSLRLHNNWKPSDEQMNAVEDAIDYLGGDTKIVRKYLMSLYEDLKKL